MANNGGRQAGGGANGQMNEHVEFTVKVSPTTVVLDGDRNASASIIFVCGAFRRIEY